ncbi:MAG: nucleotidyltransferase [bacterium]
MTRDIDIVIQISPRQSEQFISLFEGDFPLHQKAVKQKIKSRGMFNLIHQEEIVKIDVTLLENKEYEHQKLDRRQTLEIDDTPIDFISPEDLIVSKLRRGEDSENSIQFDDVQNLLESRNELDEEYLRSTLRKQGLMDTYETLLNQ